MRERNRTWALLLGAGLLGTGVTFTTPTLHAQNQGYYGGQEPWAQMPGDYNDEAARKGFHDGIEGARRDAENHRRPDVNNRDEYRHPDVHSRDRRAYRDAFRRGYETGMDHLMNGRGNDRRDRDRDDDRH